MRERERDEPGSEGDCGDCWKERERLLHGWERRRLVVSEKNAAGEIMLQEGSIAREIALIMGKR